MLILQGEFDRRGSLSSQNCQEFDRLTAFYKTRPLTLMQLEETNTQKTSGLTAMIPVVAVTA